MNTLNLVFIGAIATACFTLSLFFIRFWRATRDRFFLFFAASFAVDGTGRILLAVVPHSSEQEPLFFLLRLCAFAMIIYAIIDKNLVGKRPSGSIKS